LAKPSTYNCQVKCDSVEKQQSYRVFNMTAYRFFSFKKYLSQKCYIIFIYWLHVTADDVTVTF